MTVKVLYGVFSTILSIKNLKVQKQFEKKFENFKFFL